MTQQIRDILIYNDKEYYLNSEILEYYFQEFPEKRPETNSIMTACWRGHVSTFEIVNNELLIKEIDWLDWDEANNKKNLKFDLFPNNKFDWFTGFIRIDDFRGKYDDETNENGIYELLEVNKGNLVNHLKLNYNDFITFKELLFLDFKETSKYDKVVLKWKTNNPKMEQSEIDKYILEYIINNVSR